MGWRLLVVCRLCQGWYALRFLVFMGEQGIRWEILQLLANISTRTAFGPSWVSGMALFPAGEARPSVE
jgi:hypothetical protein